MECPRCGNAVQSLPIQGVFTCDAQIVRITPAEAPIDTPVGGQAVDSAPDATSDPVRYQSCGHTFRFADLVARKQQLDIADHVHGVFENQRQAELRQVEMDAHDAVVHQNEDAFGSAEPLRATVRKRDNQAGRLCKTELSFQAPMALLFTGIAVAAGLLWWTDERDRVPSFVPTTVTNFPSTVFAAIAIVAFALAAALFTRHLRRAIKARWGFPALLATVAAGALGYLWAIDETDFVATVPDFVPAQAQGIQSELLLAGVVFLAVIPVSWFISRLRYWQAKAARKRWIKRRPGTLERIGCGDQACSECMQGLQYLPRWAVSD